MNLTLTTDKEVFEYATQKLYDQNESSRSDNNDTCVYRGYSQAIKDELRETIFEGLEEDHILDNESEVFYELFYEKLMDLNPDRKCAVGHLISDAVYSHELEERDARDGDVINAVRESNPLWQMTETSYELIYDMQSVHDRNEVEAWPYIFNYFSFDEDDKYVIPENMADVIEQGRHRYMDSTRVKPLETEVILENNTPNTGDN